MSNGLIMMQNKLAHSKKKKLRLVLAIDQGVTWAWDMGMKNMLIQLISLQLRVWDCIKLLHLSSFLFTDICYAY